MIYLLIIFNVIMLDSKIAKYLSELPPIENSKTVQFSPYCYQCVVAWELTLWVNFFNDKNLQQNIKNKFIELKNHEPIFCYYVMNNFDNIINIMKQNICNDIDHSIPTICFLYGYILLRI